MRWWDGMRGVDGIRNEMILRVSNIVQFQVLCWSCPLSFVGKIDYANKICLHATL
jgi:hypothetical protein